MPPQPPIPWVPGMDDAELESGIGGDLEKLIAFMNQVGGAVGQGINTSRDSAANIVNTGIRGAQMTGDRLQQNFSGASLRDFIPEFPIPQGGAPGASKPLQAPMKPGKLNTGYGEDQAAMFAGANASTSAPTPPMPTPTPGPLQDFVKSITNPMEWAMSKAPDRSQGQYGTQKPAYRPRQERNIARSAFSADKAMLQSARRQTPPPQTRSSRPPLMNSVRKRSQIAKNKSRFANRYSGGFRK